MAVKQLSGNEGYLALKAETTPGTVAGTPNVYVPLYDESFTTSLNEQSDMAVFGSKMARLLVTPGTRSHGGDFTVLAEPNTTMHLYNMLLTRGSKTGSSDPYTWPFTASFTNPASYTMDISGGSQVFRYAGVQASEIDPTWTNNEMRWKVKAAALKSFVGAEIASISTVTVTLSTTYNDTPTACLVANDAVTVCLADGTREDFTIDSLTDTTVTLSATPSGAVASGDMLILKPATPALSIKDPFLWSRTEFRVAADATTALSAAHTPMESGSEWTLTHPFEDDKGAASSGSFDPTHLVRAKSVDATVKLKKFFYVTDDIKTYNGVKKLALVIRCFSGSNYEFRLTFNNLRCIAGGDKPMIQAESAEYYEMDYLPTYDGSDGQALDVKVINALSA